jgi:hypothetical protein
MSREYHWDAERRSIFQYLAVIVDEELDTTCPNEIIESTLLESER